jgi:hypothetical protein
MQQRDIEPIKFCGRRFSVPDLELIAEVVDSCWALSRTELGATVCELLEWKRPSGRLKSRECRQLLERLEQDGLIGLPPKGNGRPVGLADSTPRTAAGELAEPIRGSIRRLGPARLQRLEDAAGRRLFRELIDRYHYLGYARPFGARLQYLVYLQACSDAPVACLQYSSPAWRMRARDRWIGWSESSRRDNLQRVVNQSRFLILPWVDVDNLASHVLGYSTRSIAADWQRLYGVAPVLLETLVETQRAGTCYWAANWIEVGVTTGRGRMDRRHARDGVAPKRVLVYPLVADAASRLRES